jgi:hypothetical protein
MKSSQVLSPENVINQWTSYFNDGDIESIAKMYHKESTLFPTFLPKALNTQAEIKDYFAKAKERGGSVELSSTDFTINHISDNICMVIGSYTFELESKGDSKYLSWFTFLLDLSESSPIKHHHSSRVPFEFSLE